MLEQHLSLELYRLLASGEPVRRELLAERLQVPIEIVDRTLNTWPGVFSNHQGRIVGYWGLSLPAAYASPHRLVIEGVRLSAWCAWDTLSSAPPWKKCHDRVHQPNSGRHGNP